MTTTFNEILNPREIFSLGDASSESADNALDRDLWTAMQKAFMTGDSPEDQGAASAASALDASDQAITHIRGVTEAATRLSEAASVANIHVQSENFIRDSITGK